tara:strand:- start:13789 stop:14370 length:582 start_codon:yes stop_codon:yes gene_type:complete
MLGNKGHYLIAILSFITGAFFGSVGVFGSLNIDTTVNILDVASLIATIAIAVIIPTTVKKILDDNKSVKILLVEEVKLLIEEVEDIYKKINELYTKEEALSDQIKNGLLEDFYDAGLRLDLLREQFKVSFPEKKKSHEKITQSLRKYKSFVTGGKLMNSKYTHIDYDFFMKNKNEFAEFKKELMAKIHEIHKY